MYIPQFHKSTKIDNLNPQNLKSVVYNYVQGGIKIMKIINMSKTCCFTGHRPQYLPFWYSENSIDCLKIKNILKKTIVQLIKKNEVNHFISGMALGIDQYAAEIVLELKKQYPQITLECAMPCETQAIKWTEEQRDRYFSIIKRCDKETLLQKQYTSDCMQKRNEYMVKNSAFIIAVGNRKPSGTYETIKHAKLLGKYIIIIDPCSFEISTINLKC